MKKPNTPPVYPPPVARRLKSLEEHTGVPATCTQPRTGHYLIRHGNDRVEVTCSYAANSLGKWTYSTTLTVDGQPRPIVNSEEAYARLFADPDLAHPDRSPAKPLTPVMPLAPGEDLPPFLAQVAGHLPEGTPYAIGHSPQKSIHRHGRSHLATMEIEDGAQPDPNGYTLQITTPHGSCVQLYYKTLRPGGAALTMHAMAAVDADNRDLMSEYGDDFDAAMQGILGFKMPSCRKGSLPPVQRTNTRGSRANAVEVRRASVIRT